ncbi:MAG: hypothetical protein QM831_35845 [Kofleriaceae bacterium]
MKWTFLVALAACHPAPAPAPIKETPSPAAPEPPKPTMEGVRVVTRNADGGVFALTGNRSTAMDHANAEMAKHCGGKDMFTIVQEGEEFLGDNSSVRSPSEWRVHYVCSHWSF